MDERIELRTAYAWDCPECGHHPNFAESVTAELTNEEKVELRKRCGLESEDWADPEFQQGVELVTYPNHVTCAKCGETFKTADPDDPFPPGFNPHTDL